MQNEILLVAEAVSGEKGLPKSSIFEAIELALATATKKRYEGNPNIEVQIDSVTGDYETFRLWTVILDDDLEDESFEIALSAAEKKDKNLEIGSIVKEKVENVKFNKCGKGSTRHKSSGSPGKKIMNTRVPPLFTPIHSIY